MFVEEFLGHLLAVEEGGGSISATRAATRVCRWLTEPIRPTYRKAPSFENLQALLEIVPEQEQRKLKANASRLASESDDIFNAVETLLQLDDASAASAYVLEHPDRLQQVGYYALPKWAGVFEEQGKALAAVLAYRVLLCEILDEGRIKAYRHAANYYKALERLDDKMTDYRSWLDGAEFRQTLKAQHGRKSSF